LKNNFSKNIILLSTPKNSPPWMVLKTCITSSCLRVEYLIKLWSIHHVTFRPNKFVQNEKLWAYALVLKINLIRVTRAESFVKFQKKRKFNCDSHPRSWTIQNSFSHFLNPRIFRSHLWNMTTSQDVKINDLNVELIRFF
jgi:hypothetical protein